MDPLSLGIYAAAVSLVTSCAQVSNMLVAFHPPEGGTEDKKVNALTTEINSLSHVLSNIERTVQSEPFPVSSQTPSPDSSDRESLAYTPSAAESRRTSIAGKPAVSALEAHWRSVEKVMGDCKATLQEIRVVLEDAVGKERHFLQKTRTHIRLAQFYSRVDLFLLRVRSYKEAMDITQLMLCLGPTEGEGPDPERVREAVEFVRNVKARIESKRRKYGSSGLQQRDFFIVRSVGNYVKAAHSALAEIVLRTEGMSKLSLDTLMSSCNRSPGSDIITISPSENPAPTEVAALKNAVMKGDLETISNLTEMYTIESLTTADVPVVVLAAKHQHDFCVNALVNAGFDVNSVDSAGYTALHYACGNADDHSFLVSSLLCHGADATRKTESGSTPLHEAAGAGNLPAINELLPHGADIHAKDHNGDTPLHYAASTADAMTVQLLLDNGADPHSKGAQNRSPLHCGCKAGNLGVVRVLVEAGSDINYRAAAGNTPLTYACSTGALPCVRVLLNAGADVNMRGETGMTPLHAACRAGFADVAEALLEKGAELDAKATAGNTPLNFAAIGGHEKVVRLLVERGANTKNRGADGRAAAEEARAGRHESVVTYLERIKLNLDA